MSSARYWRVQLLPQAGQPVALALLHLLDASGTRVDTSATLTSTAVPMAGALANLQASSAGAGCTFSNTAAMAPRFYLDFDCASAVSVAKLRLHSLANAGLYPQRVRLYSSADATSWTPEPMPTGGALIWPGANTAQLLSGAAMPALLAPANVKGADLSGNHSPVLVGSAVAVNFDGVRCIRIPGDGSCLRVPLYSGSPALFGASDFTIVMDFYAYGGGAGFVFSYAGGLNYSWHDISCNLTGSGPFGMNIALRSTSVSDGSPPDIAYFVPTGASISANAWHQLRLTRSGSTFTLKIDGSTIYTTTSSLAIKGVINSAGLGLGGCGWGDASKPSVCINGYIKNILLIKGSADASAVAADWGVQEAIPVLIEVAPQRGTDLRYGGDGSISGTVKRKATPANVPLARRVRLFDEATGTLLQETLSDATTGEYSFDGVDTRRRYTVLAYDHLHDYRAEAADNLTPEAP